MSTPTAILNELALLRRERRILAERLARAGGERRQEQARRMVDRAFVDSLALVTVAVGGGDVARGVAPLTQRRWEHAAALLRLAGLAQGRYMRLRLPAAPDETMARLERAATTARRDPLRWVVHMPASARPGTLIGALPKST